MANPGASRYTSQGVTIEYYGPFAQQEQFIDILAVQLSDWQHTITAFGGFNTAQFSVAVNQRIIEDWVEDGLGRTIKVFDNDNFPMWEGFVDKITVVYAGIEVSIGPLTSIGNRVELIYSSFDWTANPPSPGIRKKTPIVNNTDSQDRYGIFHKILSAAGVTDLNATALRDTYLSVHAWPETTSNYSLQRSELRLIVECKGFHHLLSYPYNYIVDSGTQNISAKISNILDNDPNSILDDSSRIQANTLQVPKHEEEDNLASELIKGLTAMGDANQSRYLFGLYGDRVPIYEQASTFVDYVTSFRDPGRNFYDDSGGIVYPWQIRPGKWCFFTDFLPGNPYVTDSDYFDRDPRMLFIEEVVFSLPRGVILNGGKSSTIEQKLARLGLAGLAA